MRGRYLAGGVALAGVLFLALTHIQSNAVHANQWKQTYSEEFTGSTLPSDWRVLRQNTDNLGKDHLAYNERSVDLVDGDFLQITTQRHCVANTAEPLTDATVSEDPCPAGMLTRYLSGRVESPKVVDGSQPFRAEIRAKINWNGVKGTRPALWMRNGVSLANCQNNTQANDPYGELDILEWYSHMPAYTWSTSHITCYHSSETNGWRTRSLGHSQEQRLGSPSSPAPLAGDWHVWAVEYDGQTVKYFVDDKPVLVYNYRASDTDRGNTARTAAEPFSRLNVDQSIVKQAFADNWYFILNDYVEWKPENRPPAPTERFAKQTFLIDYVRLYQQGGADQNQPPTNPPTTTPQPPQDGGAGANAGASVESPTAEAPNHSQPRGRSSGIGGWLADTGDKLITYMAAGVASVVVAGWLFYQRRTTSRVGFSERK